jgi:hypothetical protein
VNRIFTLGTLSVQEFKVPGLAFDLEGADAIAARVALSGGAHRIGHAVIFGVAEVLGHLGLQGSLHPSFGELLEQAVLANEVFRCLVVSQQAVDQFVR